MLELTGDSGEYTPRTGRGDTVFYKKELFSFEQGKPAWYYMIRNLESQIYILKEGDGVEVRNKKSGSGAPTTFSVKDGKLYAWE